MCVLVLTFVMTFSTRPSTYRISLAPTGRARCRKCKQAIRKGGVRLEIGAFVRPGRYTLLMRCASCIDPAMAKAILNVYTRRRQGCRQSRRWIQPRQHVFVTV